ncbi:MAG TPA: hypothetical protein VN673_02620, partial [Clostridia bacterium]|nr:hypothetical protein [Clostridia bacterium]
MTNGWLRPLAFLCLAVAAGAAQTANQAITNGPGAPVRLSSLLTRKDRARIESPAEWEQQRRRIRQQWGSVLGPFPPTKPPLKPETV